MEIEWQPTIEELGNKSFWGFKLKCLTCGTEHVVSHDKFLAEFSLDQGYPGGLKPRKKIETIPEPEVDIDPEQAEINRTMNEEIDQFVNKKLLN